MGARSKQVQDGRNENGYYTWVAPSLRVQCLCRYCAAYYTNAINGQCCVRNSIRRAASLTPKRKTLNYLHIRFSKNKLIMFRVHEPMQSALERRCGASSSYLRRRRGQFRARCATMLLSLLSSSMHTHTLMCTWEGNTIQIRAGAHTHTRTHTCRSTSPRVSVRSVAFPRTTMTRRMRQRLR